MPAPTFLLRGRVLTPGRDLEASVLVADGRIVRVAAGQVPPGRAEVIGEVGDFIVPGFIDLQVNGYGGRDAAEGFEAILEIARLLPRHGVTGFLPTAITAPPPELAAFVAATAVAAARSGPGVARILGAHLEGPFLSAEHAGAHDPQLMLDPTVENLDALLAHGTPRMLTLAPERPGAGIAIARLAAAGVVVSAGHSGATQDEARAGFAAGISCGTHLFNAMSGFHHRRPGVAGALLDALTVRVGIIADGHHVDASALAVAIRAKGSAAVALTTDQTAAAGSPPGRYRLGGREGWSDGETFRLADGTLAGSTATMERMVALVADLPGVGLRAAVEMASLTPARVLGLDRRLGRLATGRIADITVLDAQGRVRLTLVGGTIAYRA